MRKIIYYPLLLSLIFACKSTYHVTDITDSQQKFTSSYTAEDSHITEIIAPYKNELEASMNGVIVEAAQDLSKAKPESLLGNLLADATLKMAQEYTQQTIDVGIMNYGGIRVPSINKGPVTLGNVYEVMPFDNFLVTMDVSGTILEAIFNRIAAGGGWPIAGAQFSIQNEKAHNILIQGKPINKEKIYRIALSDYLANGGDNMAMLEGLTQHNTNVLLRDTFIAYFKQVNAKGEKINASLQKRIVNE